MARPVRLPRVAARAVARIKPMVPDALWPLLLAMRSVPGAGPLVGLPRCRRALVVAAHPDDESLGCAGTMALLADGGARVTLLVVTDGEATKGSPHAAARTAALRRTEGERSAAILGATISFLGFPDGRLAAGIAGLAAALRAAVDELAPEIVFLPWFLDGHPDHRAVSDAFLIAAEHVNPSVEAWGYETWTPLPPNRLVDITASYDRKVASLAAHATAHLAFDVDAGLGLARWRSLHGLLGHGYAEAFLAAPVHDYAALGNRLAAERPE
jgi:LmbE family N-acetylglucosaminyl deacetylase